jgi:hypothetical protein
VEIRGKGGLPTVIDPTKSTSPPEEAPSSTPFDDSQPLPPVDGEEGSQDTNSPSKAEVNNNSVPKSPYVGSSPTLVR